MPVAGGGFDQCYNAQAAVAVGSLLVVATDVVQAPNDKEQLEPMLAKIAGLPEALGMPETLLADSGYASAANVAACQAAEIEPLIASHSKITNRDEPLAWKYTYGKGRVFQTLLGHSERTYEAYEACEMLRRAVAWCSGRDVREFPRTAAKVQ